MDLSERRRGRRRDVIVRRVPSSAAVGERNGRRKKLLEWILLIQASAGLTTTPLLFPLVFSHFRPDPH